MNRMSLWVLCLLFSPLSAESQDSPIEVRKLSGLNAPVGRMSISPDGRLLATASQGQRKTDSQWFGGCRIWDLESGQELRQFGNEPGATVWDVAFHPQGDRVATVGFLRPTGSQGPSCFLWEVATGKKLVDLGAQQVQFSRDVTFTPDGKLLVTNSYGRITIADAATGREVRRIDAAKCRAALAVSSDGRWVASAVKGDDEQVQIWDFATGRSRYSTPKSEFAAEVLRFSPTNDRLLVCSYKAAELIDCREFTRIASLGDMRHGAFSPDGRFLITSTFNSQLHLWDAQTGKLLLKFLGHPHHIGAVVFLPDRQHLLCAGGGNRAEEIGTVSPSFNVIEWRLPDSVVPKVAPPTIPQRPVIPAVADLDRSRKEIKQIFKADYAKAIKPESKLELARKLLETAETSESADARYPLLVEARELAMSAGGVDVVERVFEMLAEYEGDSSRLRVETLKALSVSTKSPTDLVKLGDLFVEGISQAMAAEQWEAGVELAKAANTLVPKLKDTSGKLRDEIRQQQDRVTHLKKLWDDNQTALQVLEKSPDDPAANEKVGRYLCLGRDDWSAGLSHLAKGGDAKLKAAAASDVESPTDAATQAAVADAWYDIAKSVKPAERPAFLARAKHWYAKAAAEAKGLTKVRIEARLKELLNLPDSVKPAKGQKPTSERSKVDLPKVDLRPEFDRRGMAVREQGQRGACQVFAFVGPLEFQLSQANRPLDLSEQFLMWAANKATGIERDEGHNPDLLIEGLQKHGISTEALTPYVPRKEPIDSPSDLAKRNAAARMRCELISIKHWKSDIGFTEQDLQSLRATLANRQPITATFCWPQGLYDEQLTDRHALLVDRNVDGASKSGHGVMLVGYEINTSVPGGGYFIVRNSWGTKFADKGHLAISFDYAKRYGVDAYFVRCTAS